MKTTSRAPQGTSQRQLRVGELVRHALADILQRETILDEALTGVIVSVPQVKMTPDLKLATCYVMPLGGRNLAGVLEALERHKKFLRGALAKRLDLRFVPDLRFREDESFGEGDKIDRLLRSPEVERDTRRKKDDDL